MSLRNPAMNKALKISEEYQQSTTPITMPDVIVKTTISFIVLLVGAGIGWATATTYPWLFLISGVIALIFGIINAVKRNVSPPLILAYSFFEGIFVGAISKWYTANPYGDTSSNIVLQAVLGTLVVFAVTLFAYSSGMIKVSSKMRKMFFIALISYAAIALVSLLASFLGVVSGWGFYGAGGLGIIFCVVGVGLATWSLVIDYDDIDKAIKARVDQKEAWRYSFGLIVTLIWLYLNILRILAIVNR